MVLKNWYEVIASFATGAPCTAVNTSGAEKTFSVYLNRTSGDSISFAGADPQSVTYLSSITSQGVKFGDGDTPVTFNDYKLSGNLIRTISVTKIQQHSADVAGEKVFQMVYTLTNTSDTDVTIKEIGIVCSAYYASNYSHTILIERTVLDSPVTISPASVGQITYTIKLKHPTTMTA